MTHFIATLFEFFTTPAGITFLLGGVVSTGLVVYFAFFHRVNAVFLVIDIQNDFCPNGSLAVTDGDKIIPAVNRVVKIFLQRILPIVFSRDWHELGMKHFLKWAIHCIRDTFGALFHKDLIVPSSAGILSKGMTGDGDSYSAFDKDARIDGVTLVEYLTKRNVKKVFGAGLATDYCVKASLMDAVAYGFEVYLIVDAVRGVDPATSREAFAEMRRAGIIFITSDKVEQFL